MASVTVRSLERMAHEVTSDGHRIVVDEPAPTGQDQGMSPYEVLLAALGTWTAITLRLYAERKGWELGEVTIELSHNRVHAKDCEECDERADGYVDLIRTHIVLTGPLSEEQGARLKEIAGKCPVHRTLMSSPQIIEELELAPGGHQAGS